MSAPFPVKELFVRLSVLVRHLKRDDLTTVEALLADLTGSRAAALMLGRLLIWWPKAANPDGWVYKSHRDWWAECRVAQNELPKANGALTRLGVVIELRKAEGAPTKHYRLDVGVFVERVCKLLGIDAKTFAEMTQNAFSATSATAQNGFFGTEGKREKSITTLPQALQQTGVVVEKALSFEGEKIGLKADALTALVAQYGPDKVGAALRLADRARHSKAGYVIAALRRGFVDSALPLPQQTAGESREVWDGDDGTEETPIQGMMHHAPTPPETPEQRAWAMFMSMAEIQIDRGTFDSWLRGLKLLRAEGNTWIVGGLKGSYHKAMLESRMEREVRRLARDVTGREMTVQYEFVAAVA